MRIKPHTHCLCVCGVRVGGGGWGWGSVPLYDTKQPKPPSLAIHPPTLMYLSSTPRLLRVSTSRLMSLLEWVSYRSAYSMTSLTASNSRVFSEFSSR